MNTSSSSPENENENPINGGIDTGKIEINLDIDDNTTTSTTTTNNNNNPTSTTDPESSSSSSEELPTVIIFLGMAGSGKTTCVQRMNIELQKQGIDTYYINLDPAVKNVPFSANIDIRDTVNYKEVMQQYGLGPNGGIMTSLNLFSTRFDQVMNLLEQKKPAPKYILIDTPGQIEVFTWSASGSIITELLASQFPTIITYVVDTPRTTSPNTFMSNMLYACSIMYKTKLPIITLFNKIDIIDYGFAKEWMEDFEKFQEAIDAEGDGGDTGYINSLIRSMSLVLDEFYTNLRTVGISAATGVGVKEFFTKVDEAAIEFNEEYLPDLKLRIAKNKEIEERKKQKSMENLMHDLNVNRGDEIISDLNEEDY